jgi:hypothetical protein
MGALRFRASVAANTPKMIRRHARKNPAKPKRRMKSLNFSLLVSGGAFLASVSEYAGTTP